MLRLDKITEVELAFYCDHPITNYVIFLCNCVFLPQLGTDGEGPIQSGLGVPTPLAVQRRRRMSSWRGSVFVGQRDRPPQLDQLTTERVNYFCPEKATFRVTG
jgi:hypothetical protein